MTLKWFKAAFFALMMVMCGLTMPASVSHAEIIDLDVSGVAAQYRPIFRQAEAFWDRRILGYSNSLPGSILSRHTGRLFISASTANVDGVGGILGFAGPNNVLTATTGTNFRRRNFAVAQSSAMFFDNADLGTFTPEDLFAVVRHEMGHALGFGTLWEGNDLLQPIATLGRDEFRGIFARRAFAQETDRGFLGQTGYVPIDQASRGHWAEGNFFFDQIAKNGTYENMQPFFKDGVEFISETTWASLADLHLAIAGINGGTVTDTFGNNGNPFNGFPKTGGAGAGGVGAIGGIGGGGGGGGPGGGINGFQNLTVASSVPEPSSLAILLIGVVGVAARRRRSA